MFAPQDASVSLCRVQPTLHDIQGHERRQSAGAQCFQDACGQQRIPGAGGVSGCDPGVALQCRQMLVPAAQSCGGPSMVPLCALARVGPERLR
jgi:hypothetical protein